MGSKQRSHLHIPTRHQSTEAGSRYSVETSAPQQKQTITHPVTGLLTRQKKRFSIAFILTVLVLTFLVIKLSSQNGEANADVDHTLNQPSYQTVLPTGKTIQQLGGWQRVSPEDKDPVFAYADTIGTVPISISQQPLPSSFNGDSEAKLADLAKKFSATKKLSTVNGAAYLGTSAKGPQSVLLAKNNTLILIKSQSAIDTQAWVAYIDSLGLSY